MTFLWLFLATLESAIAAIAVSNKKYGWATYWSLLAVGSWVMWALFTSLSAIKITVETAS